MLRLHVAASTKAKREGDVMIPEKKTEMVSREYWACRHPDHRHKTEAVALSCIERYKAGPAPKWAFSDKQTAEILIDLVSGMSMSQVTEKHGVSQQQAQRAVRKIQHYVQQKHRNIQPDDRPEWTMARHRLAEMRQYRAEWIEAAESYSR